MPHISIHALLAESDPSRPPASRLLQPFLSTLSLRRATYYRHGGKDDRQISIHALLAESDAGYVDPVPVNYNFYPRSPCGERPITCCPHMRHAVFLSTLSLRRATPRLSRVVPTPIFLSTLSLRRATTIDTASINRYLHFYPRSPCGERLVVAFFFLVLIQFLSTLSLRRATQ